MKRLVILARCVFLLLAFAGCRRHDTAVDVIVDGKGKFPPSLVGKWKGSTQGWEINFEPGGTISSAIIPLGRTRVQPGRTTVVPLKAGGEAVFKAGKWVVQYSPATRSLAVEVVLDHFRAGFGPAFVEGTSTEYLIGTVSEDGKTWYADWIGAPDVIVSTPEHPNQPLPIDPEYRQTPERVIFEKVAATK